MSLTNTNVTYRITDARMVAIIKGGGAIVETGSFDYREGRSVCILGTGEQPFLWFVAAFEVADAPNPQAYEQTLRAS